MFEQIGLVPSALAGRQICSVLVLCCTFVVHPVYLWCTCSRSTAVPLVRSCSASIAPIVPRLQFISYFTRPLNFTWWHWEDFMMPYRGALLSLLCFIKLYKTTLIWPKKIKRGTRGAEQKPIRGTTGGQKMSSGGTWDEQLCGCTTKALHQTEPDHTVPTPIHRLLAGELAVSNTPFCYQVYLCRKILKT